MCSMILKNVLVKNEKYGTLSIYADNRVASKPFDILGKYDSPIIIKLKIDSYAFPIQN